MGRPVKKETDQKFTDPQVKGKYKSMATWTPKGQRKGRGKH